MTQTSRSLTPSDAATAAPDVSFYPFDQIPISDSCWSLSTGPDGRAYAAACTEMTGGVSAYITRYNEQADGLDYLVEMAQAVGDPVDSGRATQCKIHYCFNPSPGTGILYAATHVTGPPANDFWYHPLAESKHRGRAFRGSMLLAYDTRTDEPLWHDLLIPGQGARCTMLDEERGLLYVLSYPRDHFFVYDLKTRTARDLGRIGSINSQIIFSDRRGRAYTTNQYGRLLRYDADVGDLEELDIFAPVAPYQSGWHAVLYDVVADPAHDSVFGITWTGHPHMFRYWMDDGPHGRIENLGPVTQGRDTTMVTNSYLDHAGGLVFGNDGYLYYVVSRWERGGEAIGCDPASGTGIVPEAVVIQMDPASHVRKDYSKLVRPQGPASYISRGARDQHGDLFFALVGQQPPGIFKLKMHVPAEQATHLPLRMWG
jgi:hypothetical protein